MNYVRRLRAYRSGSCCSTVLCHQHFPGANHATNQISTEVSPKYHRGLGHLLMLTHASSINVPRIPYSWHSSYRTCGSCLIPDEHSAVTMVAMYYFFFYS